MLTGRNPFLRETTPDTIVSVLENEPEWIALPTATPLRIRRLLQQCLEKDPKRRLRDIGDARSEIVGDDAMAASGTFVSMSRAARRRGRSVRPLAGADITGRGRTWTALALTVLSAAALVLALQHRESKQKQELRKAAEDVFYNLRGLESNLVRLRLSDRLSSDVREATYRRDKLVQAYESYVERLGLYDDKSETREPFCAWRVALVKPTSTFLLIFTNWRCRTRTVGRLRRV